MKKVVIIGAGTAGISAAKNAMDRGLDVVLYEQADQLGGTWAYSGKTSGDEFGMDTNGFMYKDLRTNSPKEIMLYDDFEFAKNSKSFVKREDVLEFLNQYADNFNVREKVKFRHHVIRVLPTKDSKWEVIVRNLIKGTYHTEVFDFVMVCNGHHAVPRIPEYRGKDLFLGQQIHSKMFKDKDDFKDKTVLVVGSSSSAYDIAFLLCRTCREVVVSQHFSFQGKDMFPKNLVLRPDIKEITAKGAIFLDDSSASVDTILHCTGFNYSFPFLSTECGIYVDDNYVQPLYKHIVNIRYPTMAFIGLTFVSLTHDVIDIQSRFVLEFWVNGKPFPSAKEMLEDTHNDFERRVKLKWEKRNAHKLDHFMNDYLKDLAETGNIKPVPNVRIKMYHHVVHEIHTNFGQFRNDRYDILNDEDFVHHRAGSLKHIQNGDNLINRD